MLDRVVSILLYSGLTRDEYRAVKDDLAQRNIGALVCYAVLALVLCAVLGIYGFATGAPSTPVYLVLLACEVIIVPLGLTVGRRSFRVTVHLVTLQSVALYVVGIVFGIMYPNGSSLIFIAFLLMLPIVFYNRPLYNIAVMVFVIAVYFVVCVFLKDPALFAYDVRNVISFGIISAIASTASSMVKAKGVRNEYALERWAETLQEHIGISEALSRDFTNAALIDFESDTSTTVMIDGHILPESEHTTHRFFSEIWANYIDRYVVEDQRDTVRCAVEKERVLAALEMSSEYAVTYEVKMPDGASHTFRAIFIRVQDESEWIRRIIIGFQCVDAIIEAERERRLELEEALRAAQEAKIDSLTGIRNRRAFIDEAQNLDQRIAAGLCDPFAVVAFDINFMKETNDLFGHIAGDRLLINTKEAICTTFEHSPVFRIGGDEFMAILYGEDYQNRNELVARFRQNMRYDTSLESLMAGDTACACGMSVWRPDSDGDFDVVQRRADSFMYQDKHAMKGERLRPPAELDSGISVIVSYDDAAVKASKRRQNLLGAFEESLLNGDFFVVYQPKFDAATERIAGAEALVRWMHPELGYISPAEFIPLFEENGYAKLIDAEVRRIVEGDLRMLRERGQALSVSINVSKRDLLDPKCVSSIIARNAELNRDLGVGFVVEVTETMWAGGHEKVRDHLRSLHEAGILIELDDFGSGYSSLASLADLPIDIIKLDKSLIDELDKTAPIVRRAIEMAHDMSLQVIAEGVASRDQLERVRAMDCDFIQGFYFSKPLSRDDFFAFLASYPVK